MAPQPLPRHAIAALEARLQVWFDGYVRTYLERDLRALSNVSDLPGFRRLMRAACWRLGQLVNQTELGRDVALPQPTVHRYLNLLETSYLLVRVPAYSVNRTKRLIKTPKLYWGDVGLAMFLGGQTEPTGAHLENIVLHDLLVWRDTRVRPAQVLYWRTASGEEVDFVVEVDDQLVAIEVKATSRPTLRDASHLLSFRREYGDRAPAGLLLHDGTETTWLAPGCWRCRGGGWCRGNLETTSPLGGERSAQKSQTGLHPALAPPLRQGLQPSGTDHACPPGALPQAALGARLGARGSRLRRAKGPTNASLGQRPRKWDDSSSERLKVRPIGAPIPNTPRWSKVPASLGLAPLG